MGDRESAHSDAQWGGPQVTARPVVGFCGLGRMGSRMAANLARAGWPLALYNRTPQIADGFAEAHAPHATISVCGSPAEVARRAGITLTMVADEEATCAVYEGEDGLLAGVHDGALLIEMSTIGPETVSRLGTQAAAAGGTFLDAPVSGSIALAESAELTIMVGGDAAAVARAEPVLRTLGARVFHMGPLGSGATMKLAVNTIIYGLNGALSEALVLAERAGLGRAAAYEVFAASAVAAPFVHYRREAFESPGEGPVGFLLDLAAKDMRLILDLAAGVDSAMPQAASNLAVMQAASAAGHGSADISAVAVFLRSDTVAAAAGGGARGGGGR